MGRRRGKLSLADVARFEQANNPSPEEQEILDKKIKEETAKIRSKWSAYVRHSRSGGMDSCLDNCSKRFFTDRIHFTNNPIQKLNVY